jgi:hypothetical protein
MYLHVHVWQKFGGAPAISSRGISTKDGFSKILIGQGDLSEYDFPLNPLEELRDKVGGVTKCRYKAECNRHLLIYKWSR